MIDLESGGAWPDDASIVRRVVSRLRPGYKPRRLQCQEMVKLVTAYLDDALDHDKRLRFEQHLEQCDGCAEYLEQLRTTVRMVSTIRDEEIDPVFRARLMRAFEETAGSW